MKIFNVSKEDILLIFVVFINLFVSFGIRTILHRNLEYKAFQNFISGVSTESDNFERKLEVYTDALYSVRGLFAVKSEITKYDWDVFNESFKFAERYPGIANVGYVQKVESENLAQYSTKLTQEYSGLDEFKNGVTISAIQGSTIEEKEHFVLSYLTPLSNDPSVVGLDFSTEQKRLDALLIARDTGLPTATEKVTSIADGANLPSVIVYLAVYEKGLAANTLEERRKALQGYISVSFRIDELIDQLFASFKNSDQLSVDVHDVTTSRTSTDYNLIYSSNEQISKAATFENRAKVSIGGRFWEVVFKGDQAYGINDDEKLMVNLIFMFMIITSILLVSVPYGRVKYKRHRRNVERVLPERPFEPQPMQNMARFGELPQAPSSTAWPPIGGQT